MKVCSIDGCGKKHVARGWCGMHYMRWNRFGDPLVIPPREQPIEQAFWRHVDKSGECWLWTGATNGYGYGRFTRGHGSKRKSFGAHRVAYELLVGEVPAGAHLDHTCHTPACVRPGHLRPVSHKQNMENRQGAQRNSTTGVRGVFLRRSGRPYARVGHNGAVYELGTFDTIEEAAEAVRQLRLSLFTHNDADRKEAA